MSAPDLGGFAFPGPHSKGTYLRTYIATQAMHAMLVLERL